MISNTGIILKLANHSLSICAQLKNLGSTLLCEYLTVHFSRRKFVTLTFTDRKPRINRHPVDDELSSKCWILITKMNFNQSMNFAKLSPSPSRSLRLRWLYFQLSLPPTQPPTHQGKLKFCIGQHNSQKKCCLPIWVGPINAYGSILSPIIADLDHHQA